MPTSHHAIAAHRLVVLAEVNTVSLDWGYLLFKLSLAEALEEVASSSRKRRGSIMSTPSIFVFTIFIVSTFVLIIRFSKIIPSFFTIKEGSTSHLGLLSSGEKKETALLGARNRYALRLADHQRSSPCYAGWDRLGTFPIIKVSVSLWSRKGCSTFLTKPLFNGLYTPFGSPVSGGQKPQGREDVAGYAIASARVLVSAAEPLPTRGCR